MDERASDNSTCLPPSAVASSLAGIAEGDVPSSVFWRPQADLVVFPNDRMGAFKPKAQDMPPWAESTGPWPAPAAAAGHAEGPERRTRPQPSWLERRFQGLESIDLGDSTGSARGKDEDSSRVQGEGVRPVLVSMAPEDFVSPDGSPAKHADTSAELQGTVDSGVDPASAEPSAEPSADSLVNVGSFGSSVAGAGSSAAGAGGSSNGGGGDHGAGLGPDTSTAEWAAGCKRWNGLKTSSQVEQIALAARMACALHGR